MLKRIAVTAVLLVASVLPMSAEDALKPNRTAGKVTDAALKGVRTRAIAHLRGAQHADGSWKIEATPPGLPAPSDLTSDIPGEIGGVTAMAVYALASGGVGAKDRALVRAVAWMRATPDAFRTDGWGATVALAMRVLDLARLDPAQFRAQIRRDAATIEAGVLADGTWTDDLLDVKARRKKMKLLRKSRSKPERGSVLMTSLAVQALWAAREHAGYKVSGHTWTRLRRGLAKAQREDGTWTDGIPTGSPLNRTTIAAALASYVVARGETSKGVPAARADDVAQLGSRGWREESSTNRGLSYVEYAFYSEHAATAAGWKDDAWFTTIAGELVSRQRKDGSWAWGFETRDRRNVRATAAALLCISGASKQLFAAEHD